jgi:hypothetical protein
MLGTLVLVLRTAVPRRRWLWAIAVLIGIGKLSFNWSTGQVSVGLLQVTLLGSGFVKPAPFGLLTLMTSLPVGAIAFLWKRRSWLAPVRSQSPPPDLGNDDAVDRSDT